MLVGVHYHTKLHYSQTNLRTCYRHRRFTTIRNYTTLKRLELGSSGFKGFTTIRNYTTLKLTRVIGGLQVLVHYHTKLHYSQTSKQKNCRVSRKCHYNIVTSYYLISLHIQMNFARVFINNYSFRILFYHIRLSILHQKYANLLIMHIFIKFFNLILCQIRK